MKKNKKSKNKKRRPIKVEANIQDTIIENGIIWRNTAIELAYQYAEAIHRLELYKYVNRKQDV